MKKEIAPATFAHQFRTRAGLPLYPFCIKNIFLFERVSCTTGRLWLVGVCYFFEQHRDTEFNKESLPWDFTPDNMKLIDACMAKYPANYKQSAMIPMLDIAQQQNEGWIPVSAMNRVRRPHNAMGRAFLVGR